MTDHLVLRGVTRRFGATTAVDAVDLTIAEGESVVLLGPSGCGKTTCLRLIAGFERPDAGEIALAGTTLAGPDRFVPPERRRMAVVFQSYALWPHMSVFDNVAFGPRTAGDERGEVRTRVLEMLELVQLTGHESRFPHELSGGQQQRVALARALVTRPQLLLLDEPLSNLDTRLREEMRGEVRRIQQMLGVSMVYVTHDQAEALSLADRLIVMNRGRIEQAGPPVEVYRRPRNRYVARSLGATNVLEADVLATDDTSATLRLLGGLTVQVEAAVSASTVAVSVRPADIRIAASDGEAQLGKVTSAMFFGDVVQYSVDVSSCPDPVTVTGSGAHPFRAGDVVSLSVAPEAVAVLAPEGES